MIELQNVCFGYEGNVFLRDLDLKLAEGELLTLTGPNGSGKTTLALLIAGILKPQKGEVVIDGVSSSDSDVFEEKRRSVGIIFENPDNQFITTSVERELAFGLENIGLERKEMRRRVEENIEKFSLEDLRFRSPHTLSGGEKQKVAIASILILKPRHLILDEPTSFLDPLSRRMVIEVVNNLRGSISIIFISQFPSEILMGDRIYSLGNGILNGPIKKEEFFRKKDFQIPSLRFLNVLKDNQIFNSTDIPEPELLCNVIESFKKNRKYEIGN